MKLKLTLHLLPKYEKTILAISKDPLHGVTLKMILEQLVAHYGWRRMGECVEINCFNFEPSITSSLRFLRRIPWAREMVEKLYLEMLEERGNKPVRNAADDKT